jgi:hypothetical protein
MISACGVAARTPPTFQYRPIPHWPPLGWVAVLAPHRAIEVWHGAKVECHEEWFCEAVWDGPFADGGFDRTSLVFGSGARLRDGRVTLVSSGSTVDRLHTAQRDGVTYASNSLVALLARTDDRLLAGYGNYIRDVNTVTRGLGRYRRTLPTARGGVRLTYFRNLQWHDGALTEADKPQDEPALETFPHYRQYMTGALGRIMANLMAAERTTRWRPLGTISSGYDSPTVTVLAHACGLTAALAFPETTDLAATTATTIASHLGLDLTIGDRGAWKDTTTPELPFLASGAYGSELYLAGVRDMLRGVVLFTGFHGDRVWERTTTALGPDIARKDQSGLSMTEFRLDAGFLHCPVPFFGVRQIRAIHAIAQRSEMRAWTLGTDYDRPIPRRILEEAGIPRGAFGVKKSAVSVIPWYASTITDASRTDALAWLEHHLPWRARVERRVIRALKPVLAATARRLPTSSLKARLHAYSRREYLFRYFPAWAATGWQERYRLNATSAPAEVKMD